VTIKELTRAKISREEQADLFQSEIRALNRAQHPNLPLMLDHFSDRGNLYIVFEHVTGMCLGEMLSAEGPLPADLVYPVFIEIAQGLSAAHEAGVVHNELTPASIFLLGDTDSQQIAKLTDFGSATILDDSTQPRGRRIARPEYASPEALSSEQTDARSDIYSIGVILYMALTGRLPFACDDVNALIQCQKKELPRRFSESAPETQIPFHVEATVFKCLAKDKEERFQSAAELSQWLHSWKHTTEEIEAEPVRDYQPEETPKAYTIDELNSIGAPQTQKEETLKAQSKDEKRYNAEVKEMVREAEKIRTGAFKKFEVPLYLTAAVMAGVIGFVVTVNIRHFLGAKDAEREVFDWTQSVPERTKRLIAAKDEIRPEATEKTQSRRAHAEVQPAAEKAPGDSSAPLDETQSVPPATELGAGDPNAVNQEAPVVQVKPGEPVQFEGEAQPQAPANSERTSHPVNQTPERSSLQETSPQAYIDLHSEAKPESRYDTEDYSDSTAKPRRAYQTSYQ